MPAGHTEATKSAALTCAVPESPLAPLAPVVLLLLPPPQPATASDPTAMHPAITATRIRGTDILVAPSWAAPSGRAHPWASRPYHRPSPCQASEAVRCGRCVAALTFARKAEAAFARNGGAATVRALAN